MNKFESVKLIINLTLIFLFINLIFQQMRISLKKDTKIQELEHELATNKVQAKQKCNEMFLGVKIK